MKKQSAAILLLTTVCLAVGLPAMAIPSAGTGSSATWTGAAGDGLWADANNWSGYKVPSQLNGAIFNAPATVTISKGDNTDWLQINSSGVQLVGANLSTASINIAGTATLGIGCQLTPIYGLAINGAIEILSGGGINLTNTAWRQSGNITVDAGGSLTYSSISSSMSMTGNLINNGGNVTFSAAGFLLTGNLYNNSGNLNVQNNAGIYPTTLYTAGNINVNYGLIQPSNPWYVTGNTTFNFAGATNHVYFVNSTNAAWTGTVSINGWNSSDSTSKFLVSNTKGGLTTTQLGDIQFMNYNNGTRLAYLNVYGWLYPDTSITIVSQPMSATVDAGSSVFFSMGYLAQPAPTFQWQKNGVNIAGATGSSFGITNVTTANAGSYTVLLNNGSQIESSTPATLTVLTTTITQQPATANVAYAGNLSLSVAVTNANSPITYQWYQNSNAISGATSATYTKTGATVPDQGNYYVVVSSPSGVATSTPASVTIGPAITSSPSDTQLQVGQPLTLSASAIGSSNLVYQWVLNGVQITGATSPTYTVSNISTNDAGTYTVVASNPAGSATSTAANVTVIQNTPPSITIASPANGSAFPVGSVTVNATESDPNGYAISTVIALDGAAQSGTSFSIANPGIHTIAVTTTDAYGTAATNSVVVTTYIPANPTVTLNTPSESFTNATSLSLSATASPVSFGATLAKLELFDGSTSLGTNLPVVITSPSGTHTYHATATDSYGQQNTASSTVAFVSVPAGDLVSPTVTLSLPAQTELGVPVTITVTATNNGPGSIANVQLLEDYTLLATATNGVNGVYTFTWTPTALGTNNFFAAATTPRGATGQSSITAHVTVSNDPPVITFSSPADSAYVIAGNTTVSATVTDPNGFSTTLAYALDGTAQSGATFNITPGFHTVAVTATDSYGATSTATHTVDAFTLTAPTVTLTPGSESLTNATSITLNAAATTANLGGNITQVQLFDGSTSLVTNYSTNASFTITNPSGTHTYHATATDSYGQSATNSSTITFYSFPAGDLVPPTVTISAPSTGAEYLPITITSTATNTGGSGSISYAQLLVNYAVVATSSTSVGGVYTFNWTPSTTGTYNLAVAAYTGQGVGGLSSTASFTATAYVAPSITLNNPVNGSTLNAGQVFAAATAADNEGQALTAVNIYVDGTSIGSGTTSLSTWVASNLAAGTHTAWATVTDAHGSTTSATNTFTLQGNQTALNPTWNPDYAVFYSPQTLTANGTHQEASIQVASIDRINFVISTNNHSLAGFSGGEMQNYLGLDEVSVYSPISSADLYIGGPNYIWTLELSAGNEMRGIISDSTGNIKYTGTWLPITAGTTLQVEYQSWLSAGLDAYLGGVTIGGLPSSIAAPTTPTLTLSGGTHNGLTSDSYTHNESVQVAWTGVSATSVGAYITSLALHEVSGGVDSIVSTISNPASSGSATVASPVLPTASFSFYAVATDSAGTASAASSSVTANVIADRPPVISITSPTNGTTIAQGTAVTVTTAASDPDGDAVSVSYYLDGTLYTNASTFTLPLLTVGSHTLYAVATSTTLSATSTSVLLNSIGYPPVVTLFPGSESVTNATSLTLTGSATTPNPGAAITGIEIFDGSTDLGASPVTITSPAASTHTYKAVATDSYGQTASSANSVITYKTFPAGDLVAPMVTISGATTIAVGVPSTYTINATNNGPGSIASVQLLANYSVVATATGSAGNYTASWTPTTAGTYTVQGAATTAQSVSGSSSAITVNAITDTGSTITLSGITNGNVLPANNSLSISVAATPNTSGATVASATLTKDGTPWKTGLSNMQGLSLVAAVGSHTLTTVVTDSYGVASTNVLSFTVDAAPSIAFTSPANNNPVWNNNAQTLQVSLSGGYGTNNVVFSIDGTQIASVGSPYSTTWTPANGLHTLAAQATDSAGNTSTTISEPIYINTTPYDVAPLVNGGTIAFTYANNTGSASAGNGTPASIVDNNDSTIGAVYSSSASNPPWITRTWTAPQTIYSLSMLMDSQDSYSGSFIAGTATIYVTYNGTTWTAVGTVNTTATASWVYWTPTAALSNVYGIALQANSGYWPALWVNTWNVWGKPTLQITSPANSSTVLPNFTATVNTLLPAGLTVTYIVDNTASGSSTTSPYSVALSIASGSHTIYATATNSTSIIYSATNTFTAIDNPPVIAITSPTNNSTIATGTKAVTITATTATSGNTVTLYANSSLIGSATGVNGSTSINWTPTVGSYQLVANATDSYGTNSSTTNAITVVASVLPSSQFAAATASTVWFVGTASPIYFTCTNGVFSSSTALYAGSTLLSTTSGNASTSTSWTPSTAGSTTLSLISTDSQGNSVTNTLAVTVQSSLTTSLAAFWTFDANNGADSAGSYTMTPEGTPTYSAGQVNNCANVGGGKWFQTTANIPFGTGSFSMAMWFKSSNTAAQERMFGNVSSATAMYLNHNGSSVGLEVDGEGSWTGIGAGGTFNDNQWHHMVVTIARPSNVQSIYIDGTLQGSSTFTLASGTSLTQSQGTLLGDQSLGTSYQNFPGSLDQVRMYTRALSSTEVQGLFNSEKASGKAPPSITLVTPTKLAPSNTVVAVTANVADLNAGGSISGVTISANGTKLASFTSAPYTVNWTPTTLGANYILVSATNNYGLSATISNNITVYDATPPSTILTNVNTDVPYTTVYQDGQPLIALVTSAHNTITNVSFYDNGTLLGTGVNTVFTNTTLNANNPALGSQLYAYNWQNASVGTHTITAVATDNYGQTNTSTLSTTVNAGYSFSPGLAVGGFGSYWNFKSVASTVDPSTSAPLGVWMEMSPTWGSSWEYENNTSNGGEGTPGTGLPNLKVQSNYAYINPANAHDGVVTFTVPTTGTISVTGWMIDTGIANGSDGGRFRIVRNSLSNPVYPASGWTTVLGTQVNFSNSVAVTAGDKIYFQVNAGTANNAGSDWMWCNFIITYQAGSHGLALRAPVQSAVNTVTSPIQNAQPNESSATANVNSPATYNGLFYAQSGIDWNTAGAISLTVITNSYTGNVLTKGQNYNVQGNLDTNGYGAISIPRTNDTTLGVSFAITQTNLTGAIGDGSWIADLTGEPVMTGTNAPVTYVLTINNQAIGTLITSNYLSTITAILPDNSTWNQSAGISATGQWPIYQVTAQGALLGWFEQTTTNLTGTAVLTEPAGTNQVLQIQGTQQGQ